MDDSEMNSACKGERDKQYRSTCPRRTECWRYRWWQTHPLQWAAHRYCFTDEYKFFISAGESNDADE